MISLVYRALNKESSYLYMALSAKLGIAFLCWSLFAPALMAVVQEDLQVCACTMAADHDDCDCGCDCAQKQQSSQPHFSGCLGGTDSILAASVSLQLFYIDTYQLSNDHLVLTHLDQCQQLFNYQSSLFKPPS